MKGRRRGLIICALLALWIASIYAAYYAVHKPLAADSIPLILSGFRSLSRPWSVQALADSALNVAAALWIGFVAYSIGQLPLRLARLKMTWLEQSVLSTSLGLGTISLVTFLLGCLGLLYSWIFYALFSVATVAFVTRSVVAHRGHIAPLHLNGSKWFWRFQSGPGKISLALAVFVILTELLTLLTALGPPWAWDSLVYHLTGPALYLRQHRITGGVDGMHFYFPALVEMLFLAGMLVKGPIVANLIHWEFGVLATGTVFCLARRFFGIKVSWLAVAVYLSVPSVAVLSTWAYVDLALIAYLSLAFLCLAEGFRSNERNWFLIAAALLGFAAGVKYTSVGGLLSFGVVLATTLRARRGQRGTKSVMGIPLFATCCLLAAALAAPWYLKNLVFTGNPFYPFLFAGQFWDSFRSEWVSRAGSGLIREPWRLLVAPVEMTVLGVEGGWGYQATVGPLLLVLLPLLLIVPRQKAGDEQGTNAPAEMPSEAKAGVVFAGTAYLFWLAGVAESELLEQSRLLFPVFGVLSVLAAYAAYNLRLPGTLDLKRFLGSAIAIALALSFTSQMFGFLADSPLPVIIGAESDEEYLALHLGGYYDAVRYANEHLEQGAKIYFLWEPRSFYFQRAAQPDTILDNWRHLRFLYGDVDSIYSALRSQGYTHVLISVRGLRYVSEEPHKELDRPDFEALADFEKRHLKLIYGGSLEGAYSPEAGEAGLGGYSLSALK